MTGDYEESFSEMYRTLFEGIEKVIWLIFHLHSLLMDLLSLVTMMVWIQ